MTDPHPPLTRQDWSGVGYIPSTLPPPPFCLSPQGSQMTTARHSFSWPIARDPIPSSSKRGSLQETHLDRRVGPSSSVLQSTVPIANNPTYSNFQPTSMSAPVAVQSQPQDRPYQVWGERPIEPSHAPCNAVITPPPSSSRFEQLLKAKLAAEKRKPAPVAPAANVAASRGVDTAFAKLQNVDTVFNRGFVEQLYNTPAAVKEGPSSEASSSRAPQQSPYPQPQGLAQSIPQSLPQPPVTSYSVAPRFDAGMVSQNSFNPPQANSTPQGDLSSVFRAIVAERISSMYANSQQSAPAPPPSNESSFLGATSQGPWTGFSSSLGAMPASPAYASGSLPMAALSVPQTPPTFKYEPWAEQTPVQVKIEEDWPPTSNSRGIQVKLEPDTQGQSAYPFLWNLTPPDHHNHERNASHRTPDMTHSASDSLDSISLAPLTPVMSSTLTPLSPVDVKPIINSPARSLVSLPDEVPMSYPSFGPDYSSRLSLSEQPRYNTLSDGGMDGAPGGGMYDSGDPNNHGLGGDGSNGFGNGFDFGQGASGSGGSGSGGDGEDHGDQDDGQGGGQKKRAARGKKLALACHFCRRRKLKCDGLKPSCDNCVKRNNKCEYDDNVRRRGPGRKTKEMRDRAAREAEAAGMTNDHSATYAQDLNLDPEHHPHLHEHHHYHHQPMLHGHEDEHVEVGEDVMEAMGAVIDAGLGELAAAHGDHHENIDPALMGLTGEEAVAAAAAAALSEETPTTLAEIGDVQLAQQALEYEEQERKRKLEADVEETAKRLKMDSNGHHGIGVGVGQSRSDR